MLTSALSTFLISAEAPPLNAGTALLQDLQTKIHKHQDLLQHLTESRSLIWSQHTPNIFNKTT